MDQLRIKNPTPVQRYLMSYIMNSKNDLFVQATTGSGKTYGYLIPLIKKAIDWSFTEETEGASPRIIIIAHSRLMAFQIHQHIQVLLSSKLFNTLIKLCLFFRDYENPTYFVDWRNQNFQYRF